MAFPGRFRYVPSIMLASLALFVLGYNWYDWVVVLALAYGVWAGIRNGLMGELTWMIGAILMIVCATSFYQPLGKWLANLLGTARESGNLIAFVAIAIAIYVVALAVRQVFQQRRKKAGLFSASVENLGGASAGVIRMASVMAILTLTLCLVRSEFWHRQVAHDSRFGAYLVDKFPAVAETVNRSFPEKMWFLDDLRRREDPDLPDPTAATPE